MNFVESESYLLSLGNEVETMKLGLENIRKLLHALGNPQNNYKKVQVAGTNGKGSVCAFLNSICLQAGIKAGLYTSPHLVSITERIKIEGEDIGETEFARISTLVRLTSERLVESGELESVPTYFEQITAMALVAFAEAKVELAILETGLGGRFDAVTAANAEIAAITSIDLDHQEYLGNTIAEIAAEKAAIIGPHSKVVLTHQSRDVEQVLTGRCREVGVEPIWASTSIRIKDEPILAPALSGSITTDRDHYGFLEFWNMLGKHQFQNAAMAIAVAEVLRDFGFRVSKDRIVHGLESASHAGRLEYFKGVLLDGAHNPGGAKALREFLEILEKRPVTLVFGSMRDKAVAEIIEILWPRAEIVILTQPSTSRAITPDELAKLATKVSGLAHTFKIETVEEAVAKAKEVTQPDGLVLVTGSLYLVGEVRKLLESQI